MKQGNLRVEVHFEQGLANTVNLIVYAEFQNVIEIDASRNVLYDYTFWKRINIPEVCFKECALRINNLRVFRPSQPCSLPTWILVRSLDRTGLRFISQKIEKENFSTLMDYPQAIRLKYFLRFWTIILTARALTLWHCKVSTLTCTVITACIMLYFAVVILVWAPFYIVFLKINNVQ